MVRRGFWLWLVLAVASAGCSEQQAAPELGLPALAIHVCLTEEPSGRGPCSDEALASACPAGQERSTCREEALAQIAVADTYSPSSDDGMGADGLLVTLGAVVASFGVLGVLLTRRNRQRNREAFEADRSALRAAGFELTDAEVPLVAAAPRIQRGLERRRRVLRRGGETPMWLFETEMLGDGVNALPPTRWSVTAGPVTDSSTLASVLRSHVDPDGPFVGAWQGDGQLVLWTRLPARRSSRRPEAISLVGLAELHAAVLEDLSMGVAD